MVADGSWICDRLIDLASQLDGGMQSLSAHELGTLDHGPAWLIRALSEYIPGARSAIVCPSTIALRAFTSDTPDCGSARPTRRGLRPGHAEPVSDRLPVRIMMRNVRMAFSESYPFATLFQTTPAKLRGAPLRASVPNLRLGLTTDPFQQAA